MSSTNRTQPPTQPHTGTQSTPQQRGAPIQAQAPVSAFAAEAARLPRIQTVDAWNSATAVSGERRDHALQKLDNTVADYLRHPQNPQKLQALHAAGANYEATRRAPSVRSNLVANALHAISIHAAYRDEMRQQARGPMMGANNGAPSLRNTRTTGGGSGSGRGPGTVVILNDQNNYYGASSATHTGSGSGSGGGSGGAGGSGSGGS